MPKREPWAWAKARWKVATAESAAPAQSGSIASPNVYRLRFGRRRTNISQVAT